MRHFYALLLLALGLGRAAHAQQPFLQYGVKVKVATLSNGRFPEFFTNDSLRRIGSVVYDTRLHRVAYLLPPDSLIGHAKPDVASRWMSPDALAEKYLHITPYAFVENNPIRYMDPDGRQVIGTDGKPVTYSRNEKTGQIEFSANASANTRTLVSAMFETTTGAAAAKEMRNSRTMITLEISNKIKTGLNRETGKQGVLYGQTKGVMGDDGQYDEATVTVYKGAFDAEKQAS